MEARHQEFLARLKSAPFSLIGPRAPGEPNGEGQEHESTDWNETLALVHRAGDAHAEAQERSRQLETQLRDLGEGASRAIDRLREQVADLQRQLDESEAHRAHAEEGLLRLCTAIREHFPGSGETSVERTESEPEFTSRQSRALKAGDSTRSQSG